MKIMQFIDAGRLSQLLFCAAFYIAGAAAFAQSVQPKLTTPPPVRISSWAMHECGKIQYRYRLQNNGASPVRRMLIGLYQPDAGDGAAELSSVPALNARNVWLPASEAVSPAGWKVKLVAPAENGQVALEWIDQAYHKELWPGAPLVQDGPALVGLQPTGVAPGVTQDYFTVKVATADVAYLRGHANLDYGDNSLNVQIEQGDTQAPVLDVHYSITPGTSAGGVSWAMIELGATAKDNYDPLPDLVLATISANQALAAGDTQISGAAGSWKINLRNVAGRSYQLGVVATDASGNTTQKVITYATLTAPAKPRGGGAQ